MNLKILWAFTICVGLSSTDYVFADRLADFDTTRKNYVAGETLEASIAIKNLKPPLELEISAGVFCDSLPDPNSCLPLTELIPDKSLTWLIKDSGQLNPPDRIFKLKFPDSLKEPTDYSVQAIIRRPGQSEPLFNQTMFGRVVPRGMDRPQ